MVDSDTGSPAAAKSASVQPRSSARWYLIGAALLLLIGAGAGGWGMNAYQNWQATRNAPKQLSVTRTNSNQRAIDLQIGQSAAPLDAQARVDPSISVVSDETSQALINRVAALEAQLARVSQASDTMSGNAARAEALLIAFAARRALDRGLALGTLESQLRLRFGDAQPNAVTSVIEAAQTPVTLDRLQTEFERLKPVLSGATGTESGLWAGFRREVAELMVVRRADAPSTRAGERLARAQRLLDAGLVDEAVRETAALPGAAAAQSWIAEAQRYHEARRALDLIETAAILAPQNTALSPVATQP